MNSLTLFRRVDPIHLCTAFAFLAFSPCTTFAETPKPSPNVFHISRADYEDRISAVWTAQIAAVLLGVQFEHKVASTEWVDHYPKPYKCAPVDDDWYYEMCAIRGFEKHGIEM